MSRQSRMVLVAAVLFIVSAGATLRASDDDPKVNTLQDVFARMKTCWLPPKLPPGHPGMQITVMFTFQRDGAIFGHPKITFETPEASNADSIAYRTAVMETLQRCTPMPFTEGLGGAVAGHPFTLRFDDRRNLPKPIEKRAWLNPKIL